MISIDPYMSEQDIFLQQCCEEMDDKFIVITAENLAEYQDKYDLEQCRQWIDDNCNGY